MKKFFLFLLLLSASPVLSGTISTDKAVLQGMDKVTGRVKKLSVAVGHTVDFGELKIYLDKCLTKTPEETPENAAFLRIFQDDKSLFSGWMFSSNPALSAMEDPVYDVWVVSCENSIREQPKEHELIIQEQSVIEPEEVISDEDIED